MTRAGQGKTKCRVRRCRLVAAADNWPDAAVQITEDAICGRHNPARDRGVFRCSAKSGDADFDDADPIASGMQNRFQHGFFRMKSVKAVLR